jgi:hypothetical protein
MFEKGNNYGKGRPSGSQNKTTNQIKEYLQIITNHIEKDIISDIDCLTPAERIKLWLSLQEYFIPKLAKQITSDSDNTIDVKINYIDE